MAAPAAARGRPLRSHLGLPPAAAAEGLVACRCLRLGGAVGGAGGGHGGRLLPGEVRGGAAARLVAAAPGPAPRPGAQEVRRGQRADRAAGQRRRRQQQQRPGPGTGQPAQPPPPADRDRRPGRGEAEPRRTAPHAAHAAAAPPAQPSPPLPPGLPGRSLPPASPAPAEPCGGLRPRHRPRAGSRRHASPSPEQVQSTASTLCHQVYDAPCIITNVPHPTCTQTTPLTFARHARF